MFESSTGSLLPWVSRRALRVITIHLSHSAPEEMTRLLDTLGIQSVDRVAVNVRKINPTTYIGKGKVEEISQLAKGYEPDAVIFDWDLSPKQLSNLEKILKKPTLDRSGVIIEIFSQHARTKEAKTQVEMAKLQYLLPRLAHFWTHFERQRGGIGMKGMGEKQLEVDRRLLRKRMKLLQERLSAIEKEREVQRAGRKEVLKVALVGYTNAGKSTLLNALTHSEVRAENKLFATLDSSVRLLDPFSHPPVVAIDTVGFISRIPPALIASFRSTLEEVFQSDLILHVIDASSEDAKNQREVTEKILEEIGLGEKPRLTVLNKIDRLDDRGRKNLARIIAPGVRQISAMSHDDVLTLRDEILDFFRSRLELWELVLPYSESKLEAQLRKLGSVDQMRYLEKGVFYRVRIEGAWARKLGLEKYRT